MGKEAIRKNNLELKEEIEIKETERKLLSKYIRRLKNVLTLRFRDGKDYDHKLGKIINK